MTTEELSKQIEAILRSNPRHENCPYCDFKPPEWLHNKVMSVAGHIRSKHASKRPSKRQQLLDLFEQQEKVIRREYEI